MLDRKKHKLESGLLGQISITSDMQMINFMAAVTICSDFEPKKIKSVTLFIVFPSISQEVMGPDAMILVF